MRKSVLICILLSLVCIFTACSDKKNAIDSENQYVLSIMNEETGVFIESNNVLPANEELDIEFLVSKVAERVGVDVHTEEVSVRKEKIIITLPGNTSILQNDSLKYKTVFFSSVAKTIQANKGADKDWDREYIEFCANGKTCFLYDFSSDKLVTPIS